MTRLNVEHPQDGSGDQGPRDPFRKHDRPAPAVKPVEKAPTLFGINGIGFRLYGRRDASALDAGPGSYIATHWFTVFFLPVLALGAYLIAKRGQDEYFVGKVPLGPLAKGWNWAVVGLVALGVGSSAWSAYTQDPAYVARQRLASAREALEAGRLGEAAQAYYDVARSQTAHADVAVQELEAALSPQALQQAKFTQAIAAIGSAARVRRLPQRKSFYPELLDHGWALLENRRAESPRLARQLLHVLAPLSADEERIARLDLALLEDLVAAEPEALQPAVELAGAYEARGDWKRCEAVLEPHASALGQSEGARMLGQIYASQGRVEESYALLLPYAQGHLKAFHKAEQAYDRALDRVWKASIEGLENGKAPQSWYDAYDRANEQEQQEMVNAYAMAARDASPQVKGAMQSYQEAATVVPVALDLGMVMLQRAQQMASPAARKQELEAAEKIFLAIRGAVGESFQYKLYLGQVYYWLGRHDEGRQLFESLLASSERDFQSLYAVASTLREVGATSEARELLTEAYGAASKEKDPANRYKAAHLLSIISTDLRERIAWLEKCDPQDPTVQADLYEQKGYEAQRLGNNRKAAIFLRKSIGVSEKLPVNAVTLNNTALVYFSLYEVTGKRSDLETGLAKLDRAIELNPSNSILLYNVAERRLTAAVSEVVGDRIDLQALRLRGSVDLLDYLHHDQAGQDAIARAFAANANAKKGLAYLEKVMVLAPKNDSAYSIVASVHEITRNREGLRSLAAKLRENELDLVEDTESWRAYLAGEKDDYLRESLEQKAADYRRRLAELPKADRLTRSVLASYYIGSQLQLHDLGVEVDLAALARLAEENFARNPSAATERDLTRVHIWRAVRDLAKRSKQVAALRERYRRALAAQSLLNYLLESSAGTRQLALSHPSVKRVVALVRQRAASYPDRFEEWHWALLRYTDPELASNVAARMKADAVAPLVREISARLVPGSTTVAYERYWAKSMANDRSGALAVLSAAQDAGALLPIPAGQPGPAASL